VHAAVFVAHAYQRVDIRTFQLLIFAVFKDLFADWVIRGKVFKGLGIGGVALAGLLGRGKAHFHEQKLGKLLGRVDVELTAGQ